MIRDREIDRLVKYCQALGIRVVFTSDLDGSSAEWAIDGSEITINKKRNKIKTDLILTLIHELGHHLWFVYKKERQPDMKFDEAITREYFSNDKKLTPKRLRKKILEIEREGLRYWDIVIRDVDIKIPSWKIEMQKEFDLWQYEVYYQTGKFPVRRIRREKLKQLVAKYKVKK
jgi:hypothetical protein